MIYVIWLWLSSSFCVFGQHYFGFSIPLFWLFISPSSPISSSFPQCPTICLCNNWCVIIVFCTCMFRTLALLSRSLFLPWSHGVSYPKETLLNKHLGIIYEIRPSKLHATWTSYFDEIKCNSHIKPHHRLFRINETYKHSNDKNRKHIFAPETILHLRK